MEFESFFKFSSVDHFNKENELKLSFDLIMDYDGRKHTRFMKKLYVDKIPEVKISDNCCDSKELNSYLNQDFFVRYYVPKKQLEIINYKASNVVIMFNGMNELNRFDFYDRIGEFFANHNIVSILLPTPFNLNRRIESDWQDMKNSAKNGDLISKYPTDRASNNQEIFHASYLRSYYELDYLQSLIRGKESDVRDNNFYENIFDFDNCRISLFGYSLGGLKALGYFLKDFKPFNGINGKESIKEIEQYYSEKSQKFSCCITFNSGPILKEVETSTLKISKKKWEILIANIYKIFYEEQKSNLLESHPELTDLVDISEFLYHGDEEELGAKIQEKISLITKNYLAITAGEDPIVSKYQIQKISPEKSVNQIILSEVDHHPSMERSRWHEVLPSVQNNILDFINSCSNGRFNRTIIEIEMERILSNIDGFEKILDDDKTLAVYHLEKIRSVLKETNVDLLKEFNKVAPL